MTAVGDNRTLQVGGGALETLFHDRAETEIASHGENGHGKWGRGAGPVLRHAVEDRTVVAQAAGPRAGYSVVETIVF
jgi:hypothetical protein